VLPDVFKTAFRDKEGYVPAPVVLWTVTIDPSGAKDAKASVVLMKFLRARCVRPLLSPSHTSDFTASSMCIGT
jgi:hypothetical protein